MNGILGESGSIGHRVISDIYKCELKTNAVGVTPDAHDVIQIRYQRSETTLYYQCRTNQSLLRYSSRKKRLPKTNGGVAVCFDVCASFVFMQSRAVASRSKASCLGLALRNARWFESSWGKKISHEISASVLDRCPPSIAMHLGSYDR
ncbi:hypothetical protein ANN_07683 [Periplaneta americana]|uniref:Uncharacterized protein n=1 Tax=Periplaneta americana TaxID=6978 RepID=A0ABQ8SZE1_PERAM|nr:hypothetical protein ANN_07683 [Periplaneta americana]